MRVFGLWLVLAFALILLGGAGVGSWVVYGQLQRDRECVTNVQRHVDEVESFRARQGRLPRLEELYGGGPAVIALRAVPARPGAGAGPAEDYELRIWRGERAVAYASATKRNTCDSGALHAAPWLWVFFVPGAGLCILSLRRLRIPR